MHTLTVRTERQSQLVDITREVAAAVAGETGAAVLVYVPHTTAGVTVNEHADPMVARDFEMALERIVPEDWGWQHVEEGEENAPTHIRASLMGPSVVVPLRDDGSLALGTWQGIFFCELDGPRERSVHVSVLACAATGGHRRQTLGRARCRAPLPACARSRLPWAGDGRPRPHRRRARAPRRLARLRRQRRRAQGRLRRLRAARAARATPSAPA